MRLSDSKRSTDTSADGKDDEGDRPEQGIVAWTREYYGKELFERPET
jgi:hypothetical protein